MSNKTGTSISSIVITKKFTDKKKKSEDRKRNAEACSKCRSNDKGYCMEYSSWCAEVVYKCLGIKEPNRIKKKNKSYMNNRKFSKSNNKQFNKLMEKYKEDPEAMEKKLKKKYKIK